MCRGVCILLLSRCTAGGVDGLCGGHHSPIQGPACRPYGGAPVTGLTNLLYGVALPQKHYPACDLSTPRKPLFSKLIPPEPTHSYHLLWSIEAGSEGEGTGYGKKKSFFAAGLFVAGD